MAAVIQEQIKSLIELQKYDSEIHTLQKELAGVPALKKSAEGEFDRKKVSLKAAEDAVKARQLDQKKKEGDLAELTGKRKPHQQCDNHTSNYRYSAHRWYGKAMNFSAIWHVVQLIAPDDSNYWRDGKQRDNKSCDKAQKGKLIFQIG